MSRPHIACYAGSFDPVTFGHLDVIERGRRMFDRVVIGIGQNPAKKTLFTAEERVDILSRLMLDMVAKDPDNAEVVVKPFTGLTIDFARNENVTVLMRGVRNISDLTSELQLAITNQQVGGMETVFVGAGSTFAYTSSTLIRQITALSDDLTKLEPMCPPEVIEALAKKKAENPAVLRTLAENDGA